jgi:hypothetical protein
MYWLITDNTFLVYSMTLSDSHCRCYGNLPTWIRNRSEQICRGISVVESSWNVMAHGDAREGKWRGNWLMQWVDSTLHITSEHGVSSITTDDANTSTASSRLNWSPCRFKWTRPFCRKTKSGFCACTITFQTQSTILHTDKKHINSDR